MNDTIKEFLVGLGFNVNEAQLRGFMGGIFKSGVAVTALGNIVADVTQQVTGALVQLFNVANYADPLDRLQDAAERTGLLASEVARYGYVAALSGSDTETLISSLERFTRTAGEAAAGVGRGVKAFEDIGVNVKGANGELRNTSDILADVQGKLRQMETGQQQALLNRLGIDPSLFATFTQNIDGLLSEYDEMVARSGISLDQAAADAATYNDELDKLRFSVQLIGRATAARLFGSLSESTQRLRRMLTEAMPKIIAAIEKVVRVILYLGRVASTIFARVVAIVSGVIEAFQRADDATNGWLSTIGLAIIAWRAFNASLLATPVGMVLALAAAIAALVEDFYVWQQGGESLINWDRWAPGINAAIDAISELRDLFTALFTVIFAGVDFVVSLLTGNFSGAWFAIKEVVLGVIEAISRAFGFIDRFAAAVNGIAGGFRSDAPLLTPSPAAAAQLDGATQSVNQQTTITVQSPDPLMAGRAVEGAQDRVNADLARNFAPRAR